MGVGASAFLFGVTVAIAIGPIALFIISVSANTGLNAGLRSAVGAAAADLTYALLAFAIGYRLAPLVKSQQDKLGIIASLVLVGVGLWMVIVALRRLKTPEEDSAGVLSRPFLQTKNVDHGHRDWRYDELRVAVGGGVVHISCHFRNAYG